MIKNIQTVTVDPQMLVKEYVVNEISAKGWMISAKLPITE
jgi:hypothetical protein